LTLNISLLLAVAAVMLPKVVAVLVATDQMSVVRAAEVELLLNLR
jgi:hypothetical protein